MKIETKANVGDLIYYIEENKLHGAGIQRIMIFVNKPLVSSKEVEIDIRYQTCHGEYKENQVFLTKEDLAKDLCK